MRRLLVSMLAASCLLALAPTVAEAQQPAAAAPAADRAELAKKLSNPISDLVSVPLQFNWQQHVGPLELSQFILNFQPVMPFELNKDWNLIPRVIMPFIGQPPFVVNGVGENGLGDIDASFFFSPRNKSGFTWGVGPVFALPASYQPTIGSGHWSIGPTGVALQQTGKWTIGVLVNQVWSVAGDDRREDVNQMFLEPFVAYQATHTVTLTIQSESTADWEADDRRSVDHSDQFRSLEVVDVRTLSRQLSIRRGRLCRPSRRRSYMEDPGGHHHPAARRT